MKENPTHNCPALGKKCIVPRAYNTAYPDKIYFKCPFCGYTIDGVLKGGEKMKKKIGFILFVIGIAMIGFSILAGISLAHNNDKCHKENCEIISPTPTPTLDCDGDTDKSTPNGDDRKCITPTPTITQCDGDCEISPTPTPEITATPNATPTPTQTVSNNSSTGGTGGGSSNAPGVCGDWKPTKSPDNFHIYRNGPQVLAKWQPDQTYNQVVIWYGHNGKGGEYSTIRGNTGYEFINVYDLGDYTFWASYKNGCAIGDQTQAPVIDNATQSWVLFRQ